MDKVLYEKYLGLVNEGLEEFLPENNTQRKTLFDAMRYSLLAGGKRIRPVLLLAVCDMFGYDLKKALPFAVSIEMIHTYSLIHDDLPSMDNDDLRRGKPTNHKVYGEGVAILAGDGLLNKAFEILSQSVVQSSDECYKKARALNYIAKSSGADGMIGGQIIDLEWEGKKIDEDILRMMHTLKTAKLLKAPIMASCELLDLGEEEKKALEEYADNIGIAFQIKDDILDVEGSSEKLGKNCGSDNQNLKSTYVSLFGLQESKNMLSNITQRAVENLKIFGDKAKFLEGLALQLKIRDN